MIAGNDYDNRKRSDTNDFNLYLQSPCGQYRWNPSIRRPCRIRVPHRPNVEDAVWRIYLLGDHGKEGVRLAFLPNSGPLDQIRRYLNAGHLRAHLERDVPAQKDREAVIAFFMLSEMDSAQFKEKTQNEALPEISEEPLKEAEAKRLNARENEDNTVQPTPDQE